MAGEKIGKTYEAILKVVLDRICEGNPSIGNVFWNESPEGISVVPDFSIGVNKDTPNIVILVTHYGTSGASHKKTWRNIGELCELKTFFSKAPKVYNIIFDSIMKDGMKTIQNAIFDGQLIVGDTAIGNALSRWVENHRDEYPVDQNEKASYIKQSLDEELQSLLDTLTELVQECISQTEPSLQQLWDMEHIRNKNTAPTARDTHLRHGYAKRLLVGEAYSNKKIRDEDGPWLSKLGLVHKTVVGYRITDGDLSWFINTEYSDRYQEISKTCITYGFKMQLIKVRSFSVLEEQGNYVIQHLDELKTSNGMYRCLVNQHEDPYRGITLPEGVTTPTNVWIYDYVTSLVRAKAGKTHAFGYSAFSHHPRAAEKMVGSATLGDWCSRFINQYLARKVGFSVPDGAVEFVALVLSEQLTEFTATEIQSLKDQITNQFIAKEYDATLLAHRGFDPLLGLLIDKKIISSENDKIHIRSCFAEKAELDGQAGKTTVVQSKHTIINWQTATDAGRDHKRKELCGRAVGLRYTWDSISGEFIKRPGVEKLILLLDGTWQQKDLNALVASGWDEIYYPDEMDKLVAAIV